MATRFQEAATITPQNLSTGKVGAGVSLLNRLESFNQQARARVQVAAQERGIASAAGTQLETKDGITQAPTLKEERIIGGIEISAHNKALQTAYVASLNNDIREGISRIRAENPDNLLGFNDALEGLASGVMKSVDPAVRQLVADSLDTKGTSARIAVQTANIQKDHAEAVQTSLDAVQSSATAAATSAREGDQLASADAISDANATLLAMVDSGHISVEEAQAKRRVVEKEATEQGFRFNLNDTAEKDGIGAAFSQLSEMTNKVPRGWTPDEWDQFTDSAHADLVRLRSQKQAIAKDNADKALEALKDLEKARSLGFEVSLEEKNMVTELVAGSDNPELQKRLDISNKVENFALMSNQQRNAVIATAQTGRLADVDEFAAITSANNTINKMALEDGYSLGVKQGLINEIPLDITDAQGFQTRVDQADALSTHYGTEVSPLTVGEVQAFSESLTQLTTPEKIAMANTFAAAPAVWQQFAGNGAGTFAMAGATGDQTLMNDVFKGQELLDNKLAKPITQTDYLNDFNNFVEGVYGAEDARDIMNASIAHFANTSNKDGLYNSRDFQRSMEAVTGGIEKVNGFKVELPRGVSGDTFEDFIDTIQPETVADLGGVQGLTDERAAELIKQGRVRNVKSGQYIIDLDNGALFSASDPTKPFVIEWSDELQAKNQGRFTTKSFRRTRGAQKAREDIDAVR